MNILVSWGASEEVRQTFYTDRVKKELETCGTVRYGVFSQQELKENLRGVDVLFAGWGIPRLDEEMLKNADSLKLVCYTGGSVAGFMTENLVRRGVRVLCGNQLFANSVAEGTIGYILLAQRRLIKTVNETAENGWAPMYPSAGIRFKTIGLIGFGMVVKYLAKMLQAFECKVKICSDFYRPEDAAEYRAEKCELEELFSTCDIVSLHESLRDETYHMIDRRCFALMKKDALFVNTARGPIIVEEDLAEEARAGHIRAVLDVYEKEPLPMDSPLRGCENIIIIPHRAGPTTDIREYVTLALIRDLKRYLAGNPELENEISLDYARYMTVSPKELHRRPSST